LTNIKPAAFQALAEARFSAE